MRKVLRQLRLRAGYTEAQFASLLRESLTNYTMVEQGRREPSFGLQARIMDALNYRRDDLFVDSEEVPVAPRGRQGLDINVANDASKRTFGYKPRKRNKFSR